MKKCPGCGMTIANQAIRCPKCKYNFSEGSDAGDTAVPAAAAAVSALQLLRLVLIFGGRGRRN